MTEAVWHDMECGSYAADLALWEELADPAPREVLDLGCGTGRVAIRLARRGHRVTGIDLNPTFLQEAERRARAWKVDLVTVAADARSFALDQPFDLVLAPMQLVQLFAGSAERIGMLNAVAAHLRPGGLFAGALMDLGDEVVGGEYIPPGPDMRDVDGWVYSSQPLAVRRSGGMLELDRLRQVVSPAGALRKRFARIRLVLLKPEEVEDEARECGLLPNGRRAIPPTREHVGSTVVVLRRPGPDEPASARDA